VEVLGEPPSMARQRRAVPGLSAWIRLRRIHAGAVAAFARAWLIFKPIARLLPWAAQSLPGRLSQNFFRFPPSKSLVGGVQGSTYSHHADWKKGKQ
jgi:hypothetical protein